MPAIGRERLCIVGYIYIGVIWVFLGLFWDYGVYIVKDVQNRAKSRIAGAADVKTSSHHTPSFSPMSVVM